MKLRKLLLLFIFSINSAYAFDFSAGLSAASNFITNAKNEIKKQIDNNNNMTVSVPTIVTPTKFQTSDSHYLLQSKANPGVQWIMANIEFKGKKEQVLFKNNSLDIQKNLILRYGAGKYLVSLFQSNDEQKYRSNYTMITSIEIENTDQRDMSYLLPSEEVESDDPIIVDLANQIIATANNDEEKIKDIHDYVANLVSYDYESLVDDKYKNNPMDAVSVLENPFTVCSGYSNLTAALLRAAHIPTRVIHGKAKIENGYGEHAWNEVLINSTWKSIDVTWDDVATLRYDYFLPDDASFAIDHIKEKVLEEN